MPSPVSIVKLNSTANQPEIGESDNVEVASLELEPTAEVKVFGVLKVTNRITNNGQIIFKSNATTTGQFDKFTGTITGTGEVRIERFVPESNRAFRYIGSPVNTSESINANLQEGVTNPNTSNNLNPHPGYGTHITGGTLGQGFDQTSTNNPSMFEWNPSSAQTWQAVSETKPKPMNVGEAYALMIRGDRSTTLNSNTAVGPATTLRFRGNLHSGDYPVPLSDLATNVGDFSLIANPYQAIVNLKTLLESTDAEGLDDNTIYVYDPNLGSKGGYATIDLSKDEPNSTPYDGVSGSTNADENLLPNQAFFVETTGNNLELTFKENYKNTSANFTDTFSESQDLSEIHINLKRQPDAKLTDGVSLRFDDSYSNAIDDNDAYKFWNYDERVAVLSANAYLSIEKRQMPQAQDEIQLYTDNYQVTDYLWQIDISTINREAFLYDAYLDTETLLLEDDITDVVFTIDENIPESIDPWRFSLRFGQETLSNPDLEFTNLRIYPNPVVDYSFSISGLAYKENSEIKVFDMLGRLVYQSIQDITEKTVKINLDKTFQAGVCQLLITQDNAEYQSKLIVKN